MHNLRLNTSKAIRKSLEVQVVPSVNVDVPSDEEVVLRAISITSWKAIIMICLGMSDVGLGEVGVCKSRCSSPQLTTSCSRAQLLWSNDCMVPWLSFSLRHVHRDGVNLIGRIYYAPSVVHSHRVLSLEVLRRQVPGRNLMF